MIIVLKKEFVSQGNFEHIVFADQVSLLVAFTQLASCFDAVGASGSGTFEVTTLSLLPPLKHKAPFIKISLSNVLQFNHQICCSDASCYNSFAQTEPNFTASITSAGAHRRNLHYLNFALIDLPLSFLRFMQLKYGQHNL